jgi:PDZ domain
MNRYRLELKEKVSEPLPWYSGGGLGWGLHIDGICPHPCPAPEYQGRENCGRSAISFPLWPLAAILILACSIMAMAAAPFSNLSQQLRDLNDPDPALRAHAREELMSLKRSDLDALRQIVAQSHPLSPEEITVLHEIVTQVILADANTLKPSDSSKGFLGARPEGCQVPNPDGTMRPAILVCQCVAGFDAYRMLRTGDVILTVNENPQVVGNVQSFMAVIQSLSPGQSVSLQILRGGRVQKTTVMLSARPVSADNPNLPDPLETAEEIVEQYWRTTFEPIMIQDDANRAARR